MKGHSVDASVMVVLALSILLVPIRWVVAWMMAVAVHEACHYLAVRSCGGVISGIRFTAAGARMDVWGIGYWHEVICSLAGPLGGIVFLSMGRWFPRTAVCALAQSLFNLLPVYPLDGGRALRGVVHAVLPASIAHPVCDVLQGTCLVSLVGLGVYSSFVLRAGVVPVLVTVFLAFRWFPVKRPCNSAAISLQ